MNTTRTMNTAIVMSCGVVMGILLHHPAVEAATTDTAASQLATKYNCQACHAVDKKLVGPAYKDIATKYAGDTAALVKLEQKVKKGGSGVWGAIPMPPNNVTDADLKALIEWILELK
jgi:cytochrome c